MKKLKFFLMMLMMTCLSAATMISCGSDDDDPFITPINSGNQGGSGGQGGGSGQSNSQCFTEPTSILQLTDGFAFRMNFGSETQYFYWHVYSQTNYNRKSEQEIISEMTSDASQRITPRNDMVFSFYNASAYTQYVIVTISYNNNQMGELVATPVTTKSTSNQPYASLYSSAANENVDNNSIYKYNDNYYFCWYAEKNAYCKEYYTYAAAGNSKFSTFNWMESGNHAKIAFYIWQEIQRDGADHSTSINEMQMGREYFYAKQFNNDWTYLQCAYGSDKYCQVITWGTNANDELSGVINILYWDDISYSSASRAIKHVTKHDNGEGIKEVFSMKDFDDIQLVRINN